MKFDCSECNVIIDGSNIEEIKFHKTRGHELFQLPIEEQSESEDDVKKEISQLPLDEYQNKLSEELDYLNQIIEKNFPNRFFVIKIALSVKAQLKIRRITQVFALILMGNPSTFKSTILEIISVLPGCYVSDSFTPKSFVSHSAKAKKEELKKVDLLPRIKHQTFITPELAPLFSGDPDELVANFGMLTRILDGRGFQSDSGVHGKRGYVGDYSFMWLGAVVDIPYRVWKLLGNLGAKIYFLRLPADSKPVDEKIKQIKKNLKESSYILKLDESKKAVSRFWKFVKNRPNQEEDKIVWDTIKDDEYTMNKIVELAMLLSKLRGTIPTWHTSETDSSGTNYHYEIPTIEEPTRASSALYNLARGHAVICGRNYVTKEDLSVVIPVTLSSASRERVELFKLLIENNGKLNTDRFKELAKVSRATALKEMSKLQILGLVDEYDDDAETKPIKAIMLKPEYCWFLSQEFRQYMQKFENSLTPKNSELSTRENSQKKGMRDAQKITNPKENSLESWL